MITTLSTRNEAYTDLRRVLSLRQRDYLRVLWRAQGGQILTPGGPTCEMSDSEVAAYLGLDAKEVTGRRDELLCRNHRSVCKRPECQSYHQKGGAVSCPHALVVQAGRRRCHITGSSVTVWRISAHALLLITRSKMSRAKVA